MRTFERWVREGGKPGSSFVYWEGFLFYDTRSYLGIPMNLEAVGARNEAWGYYLQGRVSLVQKRIGDGHYLYIAQKKRKVQHAAA
jgi:hypothetical protein